MSNKELRWKRVASLDSIPEGTSALDIDGASFLVTRDAGEVSVFSPYCPHQGGVVRACEDGFRCPLHDWKFDSQGRGRNVANARLERVGAKVERGQVWAQTPPGPTRGWNTGDRTLAGVDLTLHSHACVSIRTAGVHLLTDPWLEGPAFMGAWMPYPVNKVDVSRLQPDTILITHEHSDHFHLPTLGRFARGTRILFPDFPNRRIERELAGLGFRNIVPVPLGESVSVSDEVSVSFFEASGLWNDAILLVEARGKRILNLNDAGLNQRILEQVGDVDLLMCQFNAGASGYPATWAQVRAEDKRKFYADALETKLELLRQAVTLYRARILLPFASFFSLWEPAHAEFMEMLEFHRPWELRDVIEGAGLAGVLDLLPGDSWQGETGEFRRARTSVAARRLYDKDTMIKASHARRRKFVPEPGHFAGEGPPAAVSQVIEYFERLNANPAMAHCEDIRVRLRELDAPCRAFSIDVRAGVLSIRVGERDDWQLDLAVPSAKLRLILQHDLSWDELHIGYWARCDRRPNVFHPGFWRLLQAPYCVTRLPVLGGASGWLEDCTPVERVLRDVPDADRVLRSYGLYCSGCGQHAQETLAAAARAHGLSQSTFQSMLDELAFLAEIPNSNERSEAGHLS